MIFMYMYVRMISISFLDMARIKASSNKNEKNSEKSVIDEKNSRNQHIVKNLFRIKVKSLFRIKVKNLFRNQSKNLFRIKVKTYLESK